MNFSALSIRHPTPAILLFILLTLGGLLAFRGLAIQDFPDMDLPTISVTATLDGAAPAQLETEVARVIEDSLASLSYLDHIATTVTDGVVSIRVSFELEKGTEVALDEVRNAVDTVRADLPAEMEPPNITKVTLQNTALVTYAVRSSRLGEAELSWFVDNEMTKALLSVPGVGQVDRIGGVDREIHVDLDPAAMGQLGVTASAVSARLDEVQSDTSGGVGEVGGVRQTVRTIGTVATVDELEALRIPLAGGRQVRLGEMASVEDSFADPGSMAFLDGEPIIAVEIKRTNGFSDTGVAEGVEAAMARFAAAHPAVEIFEANSIIGPILESYDGSMHMLYEGAILAIVVVFFFLRDWRATILAAVALPLSVIPTFLAMSLLGYSLNTFTLLALSLVVGILVDDAIVEIENIARHLRAGKRPIDAAMEAANEIGLAVVATTFTLVAVFLPTAFMGGIPGLLFRQFGITAAVAVVASLVVARLLTPMMAAYFMKARDTDEKDGFVMRAYMAVVMASLRHRGRTALATALALALSFAAIPFLESGFLPASDDARVEITLTLQPGAPIEETERAARAAAAIVGEVSEVTHVLAKVGSASTGGGRSASTMSDTGAATLGATLTPIDAREVKQFDVEREIRRALAVLPGVRVAVGGGSNGAQLDITLASDDPIALEGAAAALEDELRTLPGLGAVTSTASRQAPEIQIIPDFARAAALGVTSSAIAQTVRVATGGDYSAALPKLNLPQRQIPIVVRFSPVTRTSLDDIANLRVPGANGSVDLGSIAEIRIGGSPSQIDRIDRMRNVTLSIELSGRVLGEVFAEVRALPAFANLPSSVTLVQQGELQQSADLFASFAVAMAIGVFCIYAVLVLLFHDFLQPFTILMALPLSLGGALVPLVVTGTSFSLPVVIGLLMLMGVVTKNSILLVEYAIMSRREGMARFDALVDACHKRARPIMMTTIAMACGMLPVALSLTGGDPSVRQPMAIVVIGGVITSTFLSLIVIPMIFTFVDDLLRLMKRLGGIIEARETAPPEIGSLGQPEILPFERNPSARGQTATFER